MYFRVISSTRSYLPNVWGFSVCDSPFAEKHDRPEGPIDVIKYSTISKSYKSRFFPMLSEAARYLLSRTIKYFVISRESCFPNRPLNVLIQAIKGHTNSSCEARKLVKRPWAVYNFKSLPRNRHNRCIFLNKYQWHRYLKYEKFFT